MGFGRKVVKALSGTPSCPKCGSEDTKPAGTFEQRGRVRKRYYVCYECGHSWTVENG